MPNAERLDEVLEAATEIPLDDASRFILFSDCHRGDNSWADDFSDNENTYLYALNYYYEQGFVYIELGDGDELWENRHFADIRQAHHQVFDLLARFYSQGRFHLIYGNHDLERQWPERVATTLYRYYDEDRQGPQALLEGIQVHEGLLLRYANTEHRILLLHGHQAEFVNDRLWYLPRFYVRYVWRYLQLFGFKNPTSPANNSRRRMAVEKKIGEWVRRHGQPLICGHTHRPRFATEGRPPYFNDGNCVDRRRITGIEIQDGSIVLVEWATRSRADGMLQVTRRVLEGPRTLRSLFGMGEHDEAAPGDEIVRR